MRVYVKYQIINESNKSGLSFKSEIKEEVIELTNRVEIDLDGTVEIQGVAKNGTARSYSFMDKSKENNDLSYKVLEVRAVFESIDSLKK